MDPEPKLLKRIPRRDFLVQHVPLDYEVPTAGSSRPFYFEPGPSSCGEIADGVSLGWGMGGFVVSIETLAEMLTLARAAHERARQGGWNPDAWRKQWSEIKAKRDEEERASLSAPLAADQEKERTT